ncbi:putative colanic acid biosysnthesis UDP-glucose lipid carrier transferase [Pedobacter westerhofensis]|uniref:Putative colanic acid biosysnthesis UDP-glucose lipid carrier transferase n=1 Tax=Pedobacter westerhofensis TaxID=425512 RepID=A0A521FLL7_9SPHI|nr:exopolysaccharide biosynthesis polyprenyl glycosylphosphotransferase [Pedobacter westerhofensis]SMO96480.1 putative colanic acid biosysnthesis UDP-glucose lipid carrier transferase [Pedobacter westerhofensis]
MNSRYTNLYRIFFLLADLIALNVIFLFLLSRLEALPTADMKNYTILYMAGNAIWLVWSYVTATYIIYKNVKLKLITSRTLSSLLLFCLSVIIFAAVVNFKYDWFFITCLLFGFSTFILVSRLMLISYVLYSRNSRFYTNVVIIGCNDISRSLIGMIYNNNRNVRIQGYFDYPPADFNQGDYPFLGDIKDCLDFAVNNHISEIYCTLSPESSSELYQMAEEAEKHFIRFRFVPDLRKFIDRKVHVDFIDHMPVLSLRSEPMEYQTAQIKKRVFDVIMSLAISVMLLSWLLPILAIIIKLDSPGPVFFTQKRSGKNNKEFSCLKLRSLKAHNNADGAVAQVTKNDNRTTRVGRFLRKSNLDELPQFLNVLMGQMSIVGSRPHMLKHTEDFSSMENEYMVRHLSKPGVTGWAQINGHRGEIKQPGQLRQRLEHDIWYIENWNIWLDIKIVMMTVYVTIKGDKNAY